MAALLAHDPFNFRADPAQIPPVDVRVHVENRLDVVMVHDHWRGAPSNSDEIREQLCAPRYRSRISVGLRGAAWGGAHPRIAGPRRTSLRTRRRRIDGVGRH